MIDFIFFSFRLLLLLFRTWEFFTRGELWPQVKLSYQIQELVRAGHRMPLPPNGDLNEVIEKCWAGDASLRPTFVQVYQYIESVKESLPPPSKRDKDDYNDFVFPGANPAPSSRVSAGAIDGTPTARILAFYGTKNALPWAQFQQQLITSIAATPAVAEQLRYCLCMCFLINYCF